MLHSLSAALVACFVLGLDGFAAPAVTPANGTAEVPRTVAVLDFQAADESVRTNDWLLGLADYFEMALQRETVPTLERRQIRLVLGERELQSGGLLAAGSLRATKLPSVGYFVKGSVSQPVLGEFVLVVSLVRADNASVERSVSRRGSYPSDLLPAIDLLAADLSSSLRRETKPLPVRSEFESLTWLPEAALPFFKGLECYAHGDYTLAVAWFRSAVVKDPHFDLARLWEARGFRKLGFSTLADFALPPSHAKLRVNEGRAPKRPVVAVIAASGVPVEGRAAFVQVLAKSGQFELFDPASIGATAREIDLQLTGQMAAPMNERSVWLVVDNLVWIEDSGNGKLLARRQDLFSGRVSQETEVDSSGGGEADYIELAHAFLARRSGQTTPVSVEQSPETEPAEPDSNDRPEAVFAKVSHLAQAHPNLARPWIGLSDFYNDWTARTWLLDQAIAAIDHNRDQPDAAFWLTSALWRKRNMSRFTYFIPGAPEYQENALTNDFALLLKWYPDSTEAHSLAERTHVAGKYTYSWPADRRYLGPAYTGASTSPSQIETTLKSPPNLSDEQWLARLKEYRRHGENAKAWMQANWRVPVTDPAVLSEVKRINEELLQIARGEDGDYKEFTTVLDQGETQRALELGTGLLNCLFRTQRLAVIEKCAALIKAERGCEAQVSFLLTQMDKYKDDFDFDPTTGAPRTETVDFRFDGNSRTPTSWANTSPDLEYARVLGGLVESGAACGRLDLAARVYEALRGDRALPLQNRLTATFDLARTRYDQGREFEALELLQDVLRQTEGTGMSQARGVSRISVTIESAAFDLLKTIRLYGDPEVNYCDCCGEMPHSPLPRPENLDEMNRWFAELWSQVKGGVGGDNRPVKAQLLARQSEAMPAILYNLQQRQDARQMLVFCGLLGTNAAVAVPYVTRYVYWSDPFPFTVYGNALAALAGIGKPAACAMPVLILASEGSEYVFNAKAALERIGPAPRRTVPYLARLLYHKNSAVGLKAARAIIDSAGLKADSFAGESDDQLILSVRAWWENEGIKQDWNDPSATDKGT